MVETGGPFHLFFSHRNKRIKVASIPKTSFEWPQSSFTPPPVGRLGFLVIAVFGLEMPPEYPNTPLGKDFDDDNDNIITCRRGDEKPESAVDAVLRRRLPTLEEVKAAVPPKCFEKNLPLSLFYLAFDYVAIATLYMIVPTVEEVAGIWGLLIWYYVMGMFGMSLFVVGHDCGHGTFSDYVWVNDICGHIAHAPLLAPYWPWQKSHRQHHQHTGHVDKDKGHSWMTKERYFQLDPIRRHFKKLPFSGLFLWQIYTMLGLPDGSHFWPYSRIFSTTKERVQCVVSGLCCLFSAAIALHLCDYDWYRFGKYYYVPLLFYGLWLVMITYLQHQEEEIEIYEEGVWTYVRGQTQTIDRRYGLGIDELTHHITDCHVAHHFFFTRIPHYHLPEATKGIRSVLEKYPGAYKSVSTYDHLFQFLRMNISLDYLVGRGTGLLKYRTAVEAQ